MTVDSQNETFTSGSTYLINYSREEFEWVQMPGLNEERTEISCGHLKDNSGLKVMVVAGGNSGPSAGNYNGWTEVFDLEIPGQNRWSYKQDMPIDAGDSKVIQMADKFFLSGGSNDIELTVFNTIFEYGSDLKWKPRKSFQHARSGHSVFAVPDDYANCYFK